MHIQSGWQLDFVFVLCPAKPSIPAKNQTSNYFSVLSNNTQASSPSNQSYHWIRNGIRIDSELQSYSVE